MAAWTNLSVARLMMVKDPIFLLLLVSFLSFYFYSGYSVLTFLPITSAKYDAGDLAFLPNVETTIGSNYQSQPIPLDQLTSSSIKSCDAGLVFVPDRIIHETSKKKNSKRIIPKIIHMTSKSRCFSRNFATNIKRWEFEDHELYIHDDVAVERLLSKHWSSFPHIPIARKCLRSGAGLADLWRYLVLWEYGGIYTDIDNAPGDLWTADTIQDDDDAFFVIEKLGVLSQYFMAVSPKHPLMYMAIHQSLMRLLNLDHVGKQNIPVVTGPGALKVAFKYFMRTQEVLKDDEWRQWNQANPNGTRYGRVKAGKYYGVGGRSVTVAGTKETGDRLVLRGSVVGKSEGYHQMGMKHFSTIAKKKFNESCLVHLWNLEFDYPGRINLTNW